MLLEARDLASGVIAGLRKRLAGLSSTQKMMAAGFAGAAVGGTAAAYEIGKYADHAVKAASAMQQANTLLVTQAGVTQGHLRQANQTFLTWASKLAQTPLALSQSFFHVSSALSKFGFSFAQQLSVLKAAAQGAAVGNANLEDTTNSLVGALSSGVGGLKNARQAMATILAIVGTGNMRLQEFNAAMGTGLPGASKTFGVSMQSAGAALAFLTDTGMRAQMAATRLTMAIALMGGPSQHAADMLHAVGLASTDIHTRFKVVTQMLEKSGLSFSQLASDMKKPDGIVVALQDLKTHMNEAGMSAQLQSAFIARAFGGGHMGKAIMQIFQELPRVSEAFNRIRSSTSSFGSHWQETTKTAIFQSHSLHASFSAISTGIGQALLPAVQKLLAAIVPIVAKIADWVSQHKRLAAIILGSVFAFSVLAAVLGVLGLAMIALADASLPLIAVIMGIAAAIAAIIALYHYWSTVTGWMEHHKAVVAGIAVAIGLISAPLLAVIAGIFAVVYAFKHWREIVSTVEKVWHTVINDTVRTWKTIRDWLLTTWNQIIALAKLTWNDFAGWLGTFWEQIENGAVGTWNDIVVFFQGIWTRVRDDVVNSWQGIVSFFAGIPGDILNAFGDAGSWLVGVGEDIVNGLWTGIKAIWNGAKGLAGWFASLGSLIITAIGNAAVWLYNIGVIAATGLWNGLKYIVSNAPSWVKSAGSTIASFFTKAGDWFKNVAVEAAQGLWNHLRDLFTGKTPAGALHWLEGLGKTIGEGLYRGLTGRINTGLKLLRDVLPTDIPQWFSGAGHWLLSTGKALAVGMMNGMLDFLINGPKWVLKELKKAMHYMLDVIFGGTVGDWIWSHIFGGATGGSGSSSGNTAHNTPGAMAFGGGPSPGATAMAGGPQAPATIVFDLRESSVMSDADLSTLVNRIQGALAMQLGATGMQIRRVG